MFRDYDPYRRRNGRSQQITNIPGPARQRAADPATEINRLRQQVEQASNETAQWQQAAEKYHAIAKQQQTEMAHMEQRLDAFKKEIQRKDAEALRKEDVSVQNAEIETKISAVKEENEWQEKYTRLYAEFENSKKRLEQRYATESKQNQEKLLRDMIPLADNLERAIEHAEDDPSGLEMIQKAFLATLTKYDVEPITAEETQFDPEHHEAIGMVPHPTAESGTVVTVAENGYTYQGNLLRPAKVLVAQ